MLACISYCLITVISSWYSYIQFLLSLIIIASLLNRLELIEGNFLLATILRLFLFIHYHAIIFACSVNTIWEVYVFVFTALKECCQIFIKRLRQIFHISPQSEIECMKIQTLKEKTSFHLSSVAGRT